MTFYCILIFVIYSAKEIAAVPFEIDPEKLQLIDRQIEEQFMPLHNIPGLALVIADSNNGINSILTRSYGLRDREESVSVTNNTRFLIASISKSFTATITCKVLSERFPQHGESVLDVPIVQLSPNFNFTLSDRYRTETVTLRDLLSHRTCLASYGLGTTAGVYPNKQNRVYRYRYLQEKCSFRSRFVYSNAMVVQAGEAVAHIAGKPFNELVMEFFRDLEMNDSLIVNETENYETLENMSRGYFKNEDGILEKMPARVYNGNSGAASGGIISTSADMGKYILFHLNNGRVGNRQIIPEDVLQWTRRASNHLEIAHLKSSSGDLDDGDFAYGLGLFLGIYDGWSVIGHDGDLSPFTSRFSFYPNKQIGFFTIINGPGLLPEDTDQRVLHNDIFEILRLEGARQFSTRRKVTRKKNRNEQPKYSNKKVIFPNGGKLNTTELIGIFGHPYEGEFTISINETEPIECPLKIHYGLWGRGCLTEIPENSNIYRIDWYGDIVKLFYAYSGGNPIGEMKLDFRNENSCFYMDADGEIEYKRNATLETFPAVPWSNSSCGPEYFY